MRAFYYEYEKGAINMAENKREVISTEDNGNGTVPVTYSDGTTETAFTPELLGIRADYGNNITQYGSLDDRITSGTLSGFTAKINVDFGDTVTELKRIQREAREATKAVREFEASADGIRATGGNISVKGILAQHPDNEPLLMCNAGLVRGEQAIIEHVKNFTLENATTAELQNEIRRRTGVKVIELPAQGSYANISVDKYTEGFTERVEGPAIITIKKD